MLDLEPRNKRNVLFMLDKFKILLMGLETPIIYCDYLPDVAFDLILHV